MIFFITVVVVLVIAVEAVVAAVVAVFVAAAAVVVVVVVVGRVAEAADPGVGESVTSMGFSRLNVGFSMIFFITVVVVLAVEVVVAAVVAVLLLLLLLLLLLDESQKPPIPEQQASLSHPSMGISRLNVGFSMITSMEKCTILRQPSSLKLPGMASKIHDFFRCLNGKMGNFAATFIQSLKLSGTASMNWHFSNFLV
jgi:hypothetical protein